ncbi:hypothetical protein SGRIM119S_05988 [Streptomyces griseorubiginosus]
MRLFRFGCRPLPTRPVLSACRPLPVRRVRFECRPSPLWPVRSSSRHRVPYGFHDPGCVPVCAPSCFPVRRPLPSPGRSRIVVPPCRPADGRALCLGPPCLRQEASRRRRCLHGVALAQRAQVERESAPLQPLQDARQFLRAARRDQQEEPVALDGHGRAGGQMAQGRVPGGGRDVQHIETQAHSDPYRRARGLLGHRRPAEFVLVPAAYRIVAGGGRVGRPTGRRDRREVRGEREVADHAKCNRPDRPRVTLGTPVCAQSVRQGGLRGFGTARGCSPIAEGRGARGMECQCERVRHP